MTIDALDIVILLATALGGAAGVRLSGVALWRGASIAALATLAMVVISAIANIDHAVLQSLIYLVAISLMGHLMKLGAHRLSVIVIGSLLLPVAAVFAYLSLARS